ncbi:MAG: MBL fold metallo-hydrolase [Chloroflexi bacterium]|nr:MBL fold metallo-hydrolase [Chloroflexota bacterium]
MGVKIRYLAQSGFEFTDPDGTRIVVDPFLYGDEAHGIPPSPVTVPELAGADVVLCSHGAWDHIAEAFEIVNAGNARLACGSEVGEHAKRTAGLTDDRIDTMVSGTFLEVGGVRIKAYHAHHVSRINSNGVYITGEPMSYVLRFSTGEKIYFAGDTSLTYDIKLIGEMQKPDVAIVGIGGVRRNGRYIVEMEPIEATYAVEWVGARLAIPMHWVPGTGADEEFRRALAERLPHVRLKQLEYGETLELSRELVG